jgi:hypothetical protein
MRRLHLPSVSIFSIVTYHVVTCPFVITNFTVIHCSAKVNHGLNFCCRYLIEGLGKEVVRASQFM